MNSLLCGQDVLEYYVGSARGGLVFGAGVGGFLVFFLWRRMDIAYCMAMVLMFLKVLRMAGIGSLIVLVDLLRMHKSSRIDL